MDTVLSKFQVLLYAINIFLFYLLKILRTKKTTYLIKISWVDKNIYASIISMKIIASMKT